MTVQWLGVKETSISKHQLCPVTTGIPQCEGDQSVQVQLSITSYVGERERDSADKCPQTQAMGL